MQNIKVKRYTKPEDVGFQGLIESEDERWILFIPNEGDPRLFIRCEVIDGDGQKVMGYAPASTLSG